MRHSLYFTCFLFGMLSSMSCDSDDPDTCAGVLSDICDGETEGDFCTFGYKWGENPSFSSAGVDVPGPASNGGCIFVNAVREPTMINVAGFGELLTSSPYEKATCFQEALGNAMAAWNRVADIKLIMGGLDGNEDQINIYAADINSQNLGFGNQFSDALCGPFAETIVLNDQPASSCFELFIILLHELGHTLGLGHINGPTIMQAGSGKFDFQELQEGDIKGIVSLYGEAK